MKAKYEKYKDDNDSYYYEMTLPNGSTHIVKPELGDYVHQLEQRLRIGFPDEVKREDESFKHLDLEYEFKRGHHTAIDMISEKNKNY